SQASAARTRSWRSTSCASWAANKLRTRAAIAATSSWKSVRSGNGRKIAPVCAWCEARKAGWRCRDEGLRFQCRLAGVGTGGSNTGRYTQMIARIGTRIVAMSLLAALGACSEGPPTGAKTAPSSEVATKPTQTSEASAEEVAKEKRGKVRCP